MDVHATGFGARRRHNLGDGLFDCTLVPFPRVKTSKDEKLHRDSSIIGWLQLAILKAKTRASPYDGVAPEAGKPDRQRDEIAYRNHPEIWQDVRIFQSTSSDNDRSDQ